LGLSTAHATTRPLAAVAVVLGLVWATAGQVYAQAQRNIKVVLETKQSGATTGRREITRQILGYGSRSNNSETKLVVTATIQ